MNLDSRNGSRSARLVAGLGLVLLAGLLAAGCTPKSVRLPRNVQSVQEGTASWYGGKFHGRKTASGEVYDQHGLSAAHRDLPLGTWVRVTNLENGRRVELRINDRGPFIAGRILDVSRRAAHELGFLNAGLTEVRIEVLAAPP